MEYYIGKMYSLNQNMNESYGKKKSPVFQTHVLFFLPGKKHLGMGKKWTTPRKVEKALVFAAKK